ncbi:uncharacterized protein LOC110856028 isoform X3 [Folsomia candida]|uniref:uncharacterized protein LOC110856028 isoform X3 n=1 Tax=Folsomia candida TaxID=158441 RepID=UPI001604F5DF|nr:uncharacterized protein LOC110856028 isoform X3 [Folsomia candida]
MDATNNGCPPEQQNVDENAPFRLARMLIDEALMSSAAEEENLFESGLEADLQNQATLQPQPNAASSWSSAVTGSLDTTMSSISTIHDAEASSFTFSDIVANDDELESDNDGEPSAARTRSGARAAISRFAPNLSDLSSSASSSSTSDENEHGAQWCVPPGRGNSLPHPQIRQSLWNCVQFLPIDRPPLNNPPQATWRTQRQEYAQGRGGRRINLPHRFSSTFVEKAPPVAQSALLQNIFPDKPLSIQIGNRSFQPTAKFETVDEAMPANPLATGFSRCHEKALAAKFVQNAIHRRRSPESDGFPGAMDIFNRFWNETSTMHEEIESDVDAEQENNIDDNRNPITRHLNLTLHGQRTAYEYRLWDSLTSITRHSRYPQLLSQQFPFDTNSAAGGAEMRSQSSLNVRLSTDQPFPFDHTSSDDEDEEPVPELIRGTNSFSSEAQHVDDDSEDFMGEAFSQEAVSAMFLMERPPVPPVPLDDMEAALFPHSLFENITQRHHSRPGNRHTQISRMSNVNTSLTGLSDTSDDEESVFALVPTEVNQTSLLFHEDDTNYDRRDDQFSSGIYESADFAILEDPPMPIEDEGLVMDLTCAFQNVSI